MTINTMIKLNSGNILVALLPTRSHTYITLTYITVTVCKLFKLEGNDEVADLTHVIVGFILRRILDGASFTKLYKLICFVKEINY